MDYNKLNKRINHMFEYEDDNFFTSIAPNEEISEKLRDYQLFHLFNLITALRDNNVILDGSETGTGKTYTSIALCKHLRLSPIIICPKNVINNWNNVSKIFNVKPLSIVNYESIKNGKLYDENGDVITNKYINVDEYGYKWKLPQNSIVIFDEVHKCKNHKSQNGALLLSTKSLKRVLMLTATLIDKDINFDIFGYMLGFYKTLRQGRSWIKAMLRESVTSINITDNKNVIYNAIYPKKGSRMVIKDLGAKFPSNNVSVDYHLLDKKNAAIVNQYFTNIGDLELKANSDVVYDGNILAEILKTRTLIEKHKIPLLVELAKDFVENGFNVVIFLSYNVNISELAKKLHTKCIINQDHSANVKKNVEDFQNNIENIIICNLSSCDGISLHDLHGRPRVSLISPTFSSGKVIQALGRIHRYGSMTPALQRLIVYENTIENTIFKQIDNKLKILGKINDNTFDIE